MRFVEAEMMTITAGNWETLVFDFINPVAGTPALDRLARDGHLHRVDFVGHSRLFPGLR